MKHSHRQGGVALGGLLLGCAIVGLVAMLGMKLFPIYNEVFKVNTTLNTVANSAGITSKSSAAIYELLRRNFVVQGVERFNKRTIKKHLKIIKRKGKGKKRDMKMKYEIRGPLFFNLDLVLKYDKTVTLGGDPSS